MVLINVAVQSLKIIALDMDYPTAVHTFQMKMTGTFLSTADKLVAGAGTLLCKETLKPSLRHKPFKVAVDCCLSYCCILAFKPLVGFLGGKMPVTEPLY